MFDVNTSLIRFWHKEFNEYIHPKINNQGKRFFRPKDVVNFSKIHHLVKGKGFTLEGAKKVLADRNLNIENPWTLQEENVSTTVKEEVIQRLERLKKKLEAL